MRRVVIIQSELKYYRLPFYTRLYATLQQHGVDIQVLYSNSDPEHAIRGDSADIPVGLGRRVPGYWFFRRLIYQPVWRDIFGADLIIIGPELKYLNNPFLLLLRKFGMKTVAFWGLGPNRFPTRSALVEWLKKPFFTGVDWWFAYTGSIAEWLIKEGMPADRITDVQNATDTEELRRNLEAISPEDAAAARVALTMSQDSRIGLYSGFLGKRKAIPLLIETARQVKARCPEFHLVILGDGPERAWLETAIADCPWIHYFGFKQGSESALYYKLADVFILAGTVGLAVVDSFAAGIPLIAIDAPIHPPEISYVVHGENGLLVGNSSQDLSNAIVEVLNDPALMQHLKEGARKAGSRYTIDAMAERYATGVLKCLALHNRATNPT